MSLNHSNYSRKTTTTLIFLMYYKCYSYYIQYSLQSCHVLVLFPIFQM